MILIQALFYFTMRSQTGTYALIFSADQRRQPEIGKLGALQLEPGFYIYVGSAFGPGGLKARISHHRRSARRPHWHIDYLGSFLKLIEIWYTCDPAQREHQWARIFADTRGVAVPRVGFGSSDCGCKAHLFFRNTRPSITTFRKKIQANIKNHSAILTEKQIP